MFSLLIGLSWPLQDALAQAANDDFASPTKGSSVDVSAGNASAGASPNDSPAVATRLELDLPLGCSSLANFVDRLKARSARIRFAERGANRTVLARVTYDVNGTYRATMTLLYPDGHSSSRIIEASSCSEAIEALALVTAVTLDPLSLGASQGETAEPGSALPAGVGAAPAAPQPTNAAGRRERSGSRPPQAGSPGDSVTVSPAPIVFGFGAAFAGFRGPSPNWLMGFEPSFRLMSGKQTAFSPSARVGLSYTERRGSQQTGGIADFSMVAATVDLCPWQPLRGVLELRACSLIEGALVFAEGRSTAMPEHRTRPFLAFGGSAELVLVPFGSWAVPVRASAALPAARDTYAFSPVAFYRVPAVVFGVTVGLEVRFR